MRSTSHHEVKKSRRSKRKPLHRHRHRIRSHRSPSDSPSLPVSPRPQPLDLQPSAICTSDLEELEVEEVEQEAPAIADVLVDQSTPNHDATTEIEPTLPLELLLDAVQLLHFDEDPKFTKEERRKTGRGLALSCRALNVIGTAIGWREVRQVLGWDEIKLERLLQNDYIASSVRELVLLAPQSTTATKVDCRKLLSRLRNLNLLVIANVGPLLGNDLFGSCIPTSALRTLGITLGGWPSLVEPLLLLGQIRTLERVSLTLHGYDTGQLWATGRLVVEELHSLGGARLNGLHLKWFAVDIASGNSEINAALLRLLLLQFVSPDRLATLEIALSVSIARLLGLHHFRNVQKLRISFPPQSAALTCRPHLGAISASLPHLRQLRWLYIGVPKDEERRSRTIKSSSPQRLQNLVNSLPPRLERVEFNIDFPGGAQSEPLVSFLDARRSMALKKIVVKRAEKGSDDLRSHFYEELVLKVESGNDELKWAIMREGSEVIYVRHRSKRVGSF